jgi:hypothetical protein
VNINADNIITGILTGITIKGVTFKTADTGDRIEITGNTLWARGSVYQSKLEGGFLTTYDVANPVRRASLNSGGLSIHQDDVNYGSIDHVDGNMRIYSRGGIDIWSEGPVNITDPLNASGGLNVTGNTDLDEVYANGWFRTYGDRGWYNQTYAGGWYMTDTTWIRSYGGKKVLLDGADGELLRVDGSSAGYVTFYRNGVRNGYIGFPTSLSDKITLYSDRGDIELLPSTSKVLFRNGPLINTDGGHARWQLNSTNYISQVSTDGRIYFYMGGSVKHSFNADGTKSGGSIEIEGINYGMSPIDSPQVLLEYIEFDIPLSTQGTKVFIDSIYLKTIDGFAVFPNNGKVIEKGLDYFIISGEGVSDCRIVGERIGYKGVFYNDLDAINENMEEMVV